MKFGNCLSLKQLEAAGDMGLDYLEINGAAVAALEEAEFRRIKAYFAKSLLPAYSCNGLVPGDLRLTGEVDLSRVREYAKRAFARLCELGVTMLVFGSGGAKQVPEGFPFDRAWEQLYEVGAIFSDEAAALGQTVAVEALRREEVNIVNTLQEAAEYVMVVNRPNFRLHVDFYHMSANGEDLLDVVTHKELLAHAHIASPRTRSVLTEEDDGFVHAAFSVLKQAGYMGALSYEGRSVPGHQGIPEMFVRLRRIYSEV